MRTVASAVPHLRDAALCHWAGPSSAGKSSWDDFLTVFSRNNSEFGLPNPIRISYIEPNRHGYVQLQFQLLIYTACAQSNLQLTHTAVQLNVNCACSDHDISLIWLTCTARHKDRLGLNVHAVGLKFVACGTVNPKITRRPAFRPHGTDY